RADVADHSDNCDRLTRLEELFADHTRPEPEPTRELLIHNRHSDPSRVAVAEKASGAERNAQRTEVIRTHLMVHRNDALESAAAVCYSDEFGGSAACGP